MLDGQFLYEDKIACFLLKTELLVISIVHFCNLKRQEILFPVLNILDQFN